MLKQIGSLLLAVALVSCQSKTDKSAAISGESDPSWAQQMQNLASELRELAPLIFSENEYAKLENSPTIKKSLTSFRHRAQVVKHHAGHSVVDSDPALKIAAKGLVQDLADASSSFEQGNRDYARLLVKSAIARCFFCHTRNDYGPSLPEFADTKSWVGVKRSEMAEYWIATRNFTMGLDELKAALFDQEYLQRFPFEDESLMRKYLAISIRVKGDPDLGIDLIRSYLKANESLRKPMRDVSRSWLQALQQWKAELRSAKKSKDDGLEVAQQLVRRAKIRQEYPLDNTGDVEYMRATRVLYDFLQTKPKLQKQAEASFLLGQSYEALRDIGFWNLNEVYYEACIVRWPHSAQAQTCYEEYRGSVLAGYTGSAGVFVPASQHEKMRELAELAAPDVKKVPDSKEK